MLSAVCKLRWVPKKPTDQMTIRNLEAIRLMATAILHEQNDKWDEADKAKDAAEKSLKRELQEYLGGIKHTVPMISNGYGMSDIGADGF